MMSCTFSSTCAMKSACFTSTMCFIASAFSVNAAHPSSPTCTRAPPLSPSDADNMLKHFVTSAALPVGFAKDSKLKHAAWHQSTILHDSSAWRVAPPIRSINSSNMMVERWILSRSPLGTSFAALATALMACGRKTCLKWLSARDNRALICAIKVEFVSCAVFDMWITTCRNFLFQNIMSSRALQAPASVEQARTSSNANDGDDALAEANKPSMAAHAEVPS